MLNKLLNLERPLAVLDLETTGLNPLNDRIIEIGITIHYPHRDSISWSSFINPERPITNQGSHNITEQDIINAPTFKELAPVLAPKILNVDFAGYNVARFDLEFVKAEMIRAGVEWHWQGHIIDPLMIFKLKLPRTLTNAYKYYVDPKGFLNAHTASGDVEACTEVLIAQLNLYPDLPRTIKELAEFCSSRNPNFIDKSGKFIWMNDEACINFGKWRGTPLKKLDKNYLIWMINTSNFPDDAIVIAGEALKGIYPIK